MSDLDWPHVAAIEQRLRDRQNQSPQPGSADDGANVLAATRDAAVLMPILHRKEGLTMVFTQRSAELRKHPGQISFPGGTIEASDASPAAAALRESWEEIGLPPHSVSVIAELAPYFTGSGFRIVPIVGAIDTDPQWRIDPREVDDVFEVPLRFLLDQRNWQEHSREWQGIQRRFFAIPYGERYIWGATAGMIVLFAQALLGDVTP
jgi:8-oxo-dGTP pyrophosphatase MutT (NUDIX family)